MYIMPQRTAPDPTSSTRMAHFEFIYLIVGFQLVVASPNKNKKLIGKVHGIAYNIITIEINSKFVYLYLEVWGTVSKLYSFANGLTWYNLNINNDDNNNTT